MRKTSLIAVAILTLSCKSGPKPEAVAAAKAAARAAQDLAEAQRLDHSRAPFGNNWMQLAASPAAEARAAVALGLGRGAYEGAPPTLLKLLTDDEPAVRRAAAFALGCYETRLPIVGKGREVRARLAERLFEETDGSVIASIVLALGRLGGDVAPIVIQRAAAHPLVEVREAAGLAAGRLAAVAASDARKLVPTLRELLAKEKEASVRVAAAFALARVGVVTEALFGDADPSVRFFAWQAVSKERENRLAPPTPPLAPFARGFADGDWRVRVAAFGAAAAQGRFDEAAAALQAAWQDLRAKPEHLVSERVQVVTAGLGALTKAAPTADKRVLDVLSAIHAQSTGKPELEPRAQGALELFGCLAALALDVKDGLPSRVFKCGSTRLFDWQRGRLAAQVLERVMGGDREKRIAALTKLAKDADPRVRSGIGDALVRMINAREVRALVLLALRTRDAAVLGGLGDALGKRPYRDPEIEAALIAGATALRGGRDADAMVSVSEALAAVGGPKSAPTLMRLGADPSRGVREAAMKAFRKLFPADPELPPSEVGMKEHPAAIESAGAELVVAVRTTKGEVAIRLLRHLAPLTVGSFLALVQKGFYKDQTIHRVVPAFVAQMGDPRGDGSGGPGYALPCELTPTRYRRGSVGMALAGRDTGGSQFFITQVDTPHLDGAYPLFGEVIRGMEIVDALQEGDRLLDIRLVDSK